MNKDEADSHAEQRTERKHTEARGNSPIAPTFLQPHLNFDQLSLVCITHRFQIQPRRAIYVVVLRASEVNFMYEAQIGS
jgi:hypothetical protein